MVQHANSKVGLGRSSGKAKTPSIPSSTTPSVSKSASAQKRRKLNKDDTRVSPSSLRPSLAIPSNFAATSPTSHEAMLNSLIDPPTPIADIFASVVSSPTSPNRDKSLAEKAFARDEHCVVTLNPSESMVQGAHIIPYAMADASTSPQADIWRLLKCFWEDDKVDKWAIAMQANHETLANMITLSCDAHNAFDIAYMGLEPVEIMDGGRTIKLRFHWLKRDRQRKEKVPPTAKPEFSSDACRGPGGCKLFNVETNQLVTSGTEIFVSSFIHANLPSFDLLQMRWTLNRVAALCAGAELEELDDDDDDEDCHEV